MANKFVKLGNIVGMPIEDIIKRVGKPNSISVLHKVHLYQWMRTGVFVGSYHYSIKVDPEGKALGYQHMFTKAGLIFK